MTLSTPSRERTFKGETGSPLSVLDIPDDAGYRLTEASSSTSAPSSMSSYHTAEEPVREPAHQDYREVDGPTSNLCQSSDSGVAEREEPTLSDLILQRNWPEARQRLASESHEHEIYERIPMPYTSQDTSHALPLHLACALRPLPPASFVRFLIKLHPDAARVQEETWGLLPLHFAANMMHEKEETLRKDIDRTYMDKESTFAGGALDARERCAFNQRCIVACLVDAYPESLCMKESFSGMLPIHIAASTASSHYSSLTSNAVSMLELLIQRCPASVEVLNDGGETPRDIAWRNATFNCLRCRVRGRYVASEHGRCPHMVLPSQGKANPLLREDFSCYFEMGSRYGEDIKTLTSLGGGTDTTTMSDESHRLGWKADSDIRRDDLSSITSGDSQAKSVKDTVIRLATQNEWSVTLQIRLESLHGGKGKRWSKKLRQKPPNPFFEISVLQNDSLAEGETIYRSYPMMKTKDATWEKITSLDMKVDAASCPRKPRFRITVFDCDTHGGNHLLIGESEVHSADLARQTARLIPIRRGDKVKGFLRLVHFQLDSA